MKSEIKTCVQENNEVGDAILEVIDDKELLLSTAGSIDYIS